MNELQKHLKEIRGNNPTWLCYDGPEGYEWPKSYEEYKGMVGVLQKEMQEFEDEINKLKEQVAKLVTNGINSHV